MMEKLTSRKFIIAASGIITGIILICVGETAKGTTLLVTSVISYLAAEGYIDAKAVIAIKETLEKDNEE